MEEIKYEPFSGDLTIETAAVQAVYALDSSATIAERQSDAAGLLAVAEQWMKLADFLAALREAEAKLPEKKVEGRPFGFTPTVVDLNEEDSIELADKDEELDVRDDED